MGGVQMAVHWWEEWQLRVLALASLAVQYILLITSAKRRYPSRSWWLRPLTWLAYLGSDAIAIYALATLFNRHKKRDDGGYGYSVLEVVWAPILLIHLGGQDGITAYNIEDNELWTRHVLTAVSQITVAVYVFWKSWPGGDRRLLQAAILLFIPGILKCIEKPWALNSASINSLVSSGGSRRTTKIQGKIDALDEFVRSAAAGFGAAGAGAEASNGDVEAGTRSGADSEARNGDAEAGTPPGADSEAATPPVEDEVPDFQPDKLFVDLASPSSEERLKTLQSFPSADGNKAYRILHDGLHQTFDLLYTKQKMFSSLLLVRELEEDGGKPKNPFAKYAALARSFFGGIVVRGTGLYLIFAAIALFDHSHRKAYSDNDVKVTYAMICCTAGLEFFVVGTRGRIGPSAAEERQDESKTNEAGEMQSRSMDDMVFQHNLLGLLARDLKHPKLMSVVGFLHRRDYLHQRWHMKPCSSSRRITSLVLKHLRGGWKEHIKDVPSYRKFNENRGQFTLERHGCSDSLGWTLDGAFDESVLLWHLATDFCYYYKGTASCQDRAILCRQISSYMMYLLFVNPEMLMPGTRRDIFTAAYDELESILGKDDRPPRLEERELAHRIISKLDGNGSAADPKPPEEFISEISKLDGNGSAADPKPPEEFIREISKLDGNGSAADPEPEGRFVHDAWYVAKVLIALPQGEMWTVIEGVWVEMLCFSAGRCRGYLHAKGLGTGVEYLSYVWLLLYYMGMETMADRLQRVERSTNQAAAPPTPQDRGATAE